MNDILPPQTQLVPITTTPSPPPSIKAVQHASRFTEHFDIVLPPTAFELFLQNETTSEIAQPQQRSMSISASRPAVVAKPVRMHSSPAITTSASFMVDEQPSPTVHATDAPTATATTTTTTTSNSQDTSPSPPTPLTVTSSSSNSKQQPIALLYKDYTSTTTHCLNRADIMIKRLGNWLVFLKLSAGWLVEIQKMTASSAFKRLKKDHPERYDHINKQRKHGQTLIAQFKKECREKIHALKINPALHMEELLLRANETRKRMVHLSKLCDLANQQQPPHLPELDPWLANLQVLRYLKRETTEENRLRALMVPIQQDMQTLEHNLTEAFEDVVAFCVEQETTVTQYGANLDQVLAHFLPQHTWSAFVAAQQAKKEWVDEDAIQKNYLQINYPNKQHPHVATVRKGVLGRRSGVLKHYHDKYYVLTHYGYLHQFKLDDKVKPEASIYVTSTTIQPPINDDDDHLFDDLQQQQQLDDAGGHTFDIRQPKRKTYHFKTTTAQELVAWCRALTNVANGSSVEKLLAQRKQHKQINVTKPLGLTDSNSSIASSLTAPRPPLLSPPPPPSFVDDEDDFHSIHNDHDDDTSTLDHHPPPVAEGDLVSLAIGHDGAKPVGSSSSSLEPQHPTTTHPYQDETGIYFSSTSSPAPPSRRAVPTYQANLNLMVTSPPSS